MNYPNSLRQMIWLALGVLCGCCACCARSAREPPDLATPTVPRPTRNLAPPTPTSWWSNTRAAGTSDVHVKPIDQVIGTGRVLDLALSPDEKIMYGLGGHIDEGGWAEPHVREVVRPEDMIAIADSFADGLGDGGMVPHFRSTRQWPSKRHNGAAVVLFCDGHAVRMFLEDLVAEDDVVRRRWNNDHQSHREYWQDPDR